MKQMKTYIEKHHLVQYGDKIVVAFSGGPDSVYLLLGLLELKDQMNLSLAAVHINHRLQGIAEEHARFARRFCEEHQVDFYYYEKEIKTYARELRLSIEEAGRKYRYEKFYEVKEMLGFDSIAVAHHQDDRAETVLYRMARGTGWKGMAGIRPVQDEIIRPMLGISKKEILAYLDQNGQNYNIDPSNEDTIYARNQIRHRVVPELENVNRQAVRHICDLADQMEEVGQYLETEIERQYRCCVRQQEDHWNISIAELMKIPVFMQKEVLKKSMEQAAGHKKDLTRNHVEELLRMISVQTGKKMDLPYQLQAVRQYGDIVLKKKQQLPSGSIEIPGEGQYLVPFANGRLLVKIFQKAQEISQKMYTKTFDYDKINTCITVRTYQKGDYFVMNRAGQHKKLNRYFIDQKIPRDQRDQIPVVADGSHIIWIIGKRISEEYKVTEKTTRVLQLTWKWMEEE